MPEANIYDRESIENNKEEVPFEHYCSLFKEAWPDEITGRTGVPYDPEKQEFKIDLMGTLYRIHWPEFAISSETGYGLALTNIPSKTFLLRYLLEGKRTENVHKFLTFREMPWGELYIKPYTGRCIQRGAFTFGTRLDSFREACEKIGARKVAHGDAAYEFNLTGNYAMQIIVWEGDDEFPPNCQILYSDNFKEGFSPEDRVVAGDIAITAIKSFFPTK